MNESSSLTTPPPGYVHYQNLFADWHAWDNKPAWLLLLWANLVALWPLAAGIILLWLPYQLYRLAGTPLAVYPDLALATGEVVAAGAIIIAASMLVHEWLHGLALLWCGYKPRYGFSKFWLVATVSDGAYLTRQHYLAMSLTPITAMTLMGGLVLPLLPPVVGQLLLIALLLNMAASVGDLIVTIRVYRMPKEALFADDEGIQVFVPTSQVKEMPPG